jgi:SAM-dependent methyltransferase
VKEGKEMDKNGKWDTWNCLRAPKYPHEKLIQFIFRSFPNDREKIRILDLGCGSGANTYFLTQEGFNVFATDISQVAINNTIRKLDGLKADIKRGTVSRIDFADNSFDSVVSLGVLECAGLPDFSNAMLEIVRVLKLGGIAFLLFASDSDYRIVGANELGLHGFTDKQIESVKAEITENIEFFWMDRYVTTYNDKAMQENNHIITFRKKSK